jgi:di/tricarboxylate transporter
MYKEGGISWLEEWLLASQEGLSSTIIIIIIIIIIITFHILSNTLTIKCFVFVVRFRD